MGVDYTPQDLITALDPSWAEKGRENTRRANAFAAAAKAAIEALQAAVTIKKIKLGSTTYSPDSDGLVTLPAGVVAPPMTTTERDALANPAVGQLIENTTTGLTERYTASGWRPIGSYGQPMTTTQRDALSNPVNGLIIDNTTLGRSQIRRAGAWADLTPSATLKAQGTYTGDGAASRAITVGFTPDLAFVNLGSSYAWIHSTNSAFQQGAYIQGSNSSPLNNCYIQSNGFVIRSQSPFNNTGLNVSGESGTWTALKLV